MYKIPTQYLILKKPYAKYKYLKEKANYQYFASCYQRRKYRSV